MRSTRHALATTLAAAAALALPAGAAAAAPWSVPAPIPAATGVPTGPVFTPAGRGVLVVTRSTEQQGRAASLLDTIAADGSVTASRPLAFAADSIATYGSDRIAVAGRTVAAAGPYIGTITDNSSIVTRFGTPTALGATRTVAGSKGRQLYALASNRNGLMALVMGGPRTRTLLIRRPGASTFATKLRVTVSSRARGATVAVGTRGDVLLVYEDDHEVRARHIGTRGTVGAVHRIGAGVQSNLQAVVSDDGRLAVAWSSQRVDEGEAATPAIVSFATAAPGHGFGKARTIATVGSTSAGRYVAEPVVRLLGIGDDALLAYTGFDGTNYTVEARQVSAGHLGAAQQLSPAGIDAVLGDAAVAPNGTQVVTWRAGIAGADPAPAPSGQSPRAPVLANVGGAGGGAFGPAEAVSPIDADVRSAPAAAIDPAGGRAIVVYGDFATASVLIASRPPA